MAGGGKVAIIIVVVIVIIILIIAIAGIGYYFYRRKKIQKQVTQVLASSDTTTPTTSTTTTTTASRALTSYSGSLGNRTLTLMWNSITSGLYALEYNGNLQYGCFNAANNVLGGSKVMIYAPSYSGSPVALPDPVTCDNIYGEVIATLVVSPPNALGSVTVTVTSVKSSSNNTLSLGSGDNFILNK